MAGASQSDSHSLRHLGRCVEKAHPLVKGRFQLRHKDFFYFLVHKAIVQPPIRRGVVLQQWLGLIRPGDSQTTQSSVPGIVLEAVDVTDSFPTSRVLVSHRLAVDHQSFFHFVGEALSRIGKWPAPKVKARLVVFRAVECRQDGGGRVMDKVLRNVIGTVNLFFRGHLFGLFPWRLPIAIVRLQHGNIEWDAQIKARFAAPTILAVGDGDGCVNVRVPRPRPPRSKGNNARVFLIQLVEQ